MNVPPFKKLVIERMTVILLPPGKASIGTAVAALSSPDCMISAAKLAEEWAKQACAVVRTGSEPNPWKNATDDEIATEILRKVEAKRQAQKSAHRAT